MNEELHQRGSRLYWIWHNMKARCQNPNATGYKYYGGRGISVCEEWQSYKPFREWAKKIGISRKTITLRKRMGWNDEKIIKTPLEIHQSRKG